MELWALPKITAPDNLRQDPLWRRPPARVPLGSRHPRAKAPLLPFPLVGGQKPRAEDVLDEALAREKLGGRLAADRRCWRATLAAPGKSPRCWTWPMTSRRCARCAAPARLRQDPLWRRATPAVPQWAAARQEAPGVDRCPPRILPVSAPLSLPRLPHRTIVVQLSRLAAGVGGAALAALMAGTVVTSATSLPDEPLYGVKRLVEDAQLVITPPESRVDAHLRRAQERMKETQEMIERDRAEAVPALVDAYVREVDAVRTELQSPRTRVPEPEKVEKVLTRLEANEQVLGAMAERVAELARPAVARAVEASRPENVAPAESPRSVAPPESGSRSVGPWRPRRSAPGGLASVQEPGRSTVRQLIEATSTPAPSATRPRCGRPRSRRLLLNAAGRTPGRPRTLAAARLLARRRPRRIRPVRRVVVHDERAVAQPIGHADQADRRRRPGRRRPRCSRSYRRPAPSSAEPARDQPGGPARDEPRGTLPAPSTSSATQPTPLSSPAGRTAEPTDRAAPERSSAAPSLVPAAEPSDRGTPDPAAPCRRWRPRRARPARRPDTSEAPTLLPAAIRFEGVAKRFTIHHERARSLQELVLSAFRPRGGAGSSLGAARR